MSVFTKIIKGELPCYKIFENDSVISFLALDQVTRGHTLVVPKREVDVWFDLEDSELTEVHLAAKKIAAAIKKATQCERVGTATVGFEVPHFHLHLIPMLGPSDLNFSKGKVLPADEMAVIQKSIIEQLK